MFVCDCPALALLLHLGICPCVSLGWSQDLAFFCEISPENIRPELSSDVPMQVSESGASDTRNKNNLYFFLAQGKKKKNRSSITNIRCCWCQQEQPAQPNQMVLRCNLAVIPPPGFPWLLPDSRNWFLSLL